MKFKSFNNHISRVTFIVALTLGVFSCNTELLDPLPLTTFSDIVVFDTPARVDLQMNGVYSAMKNGNFLGGRYQVYGDIRSEDFINRTTNGVTGYGVWNHTLTETGQNDVINCWNFAYQGINQANVFLQGMQDNAAKFIPPTFPANYATTTAVQVVGEAKFLRALAYYSLLQLYARPFSDGAGSKPGLPLRLKAEKNAENNDLARSTVAEVYAQILTDLNEAEASVALNFTGATASTLRVTRAHRNAVIALKVRVYMAMGNYNSAITEAAKIVSGTGPFTAPTGVPNALSATIAAVFTAPQETSESMFSFPFSAQNAPGTQNQLGFYYNASTNSQGGGGEYALNSAGIIANTTEWVATDARRAFNVAAAASGGAFFLRKYVTPTPYTDNAPVLRYSEVLLNLAEARVRSTSTVDATAIALLNAVHRRSDTSITFVAGDFATPQDLINKILLEKRIEFLGEGLRNGDLMRMQATIPGKASVAAVPPSSINYIWPIPSSELAANTLMTRN